ncbi:MAG TPA: ATP-binding protein [Algoriphagus sp.]|nr:ATP-binding protein [Algoriphagus sp.]
MKFFIKIFLLCFIPATSMAQKDPSWGYINKQQADSLKRSILNESNDTLRLAAFRLLGFYYQDFIADSGLYFHEQQLALSEKLEMRLWQADAYSQAGYVLAGLGNVMKAYEYHSEAMKLAEDENNESDNWRPWVFSNSKNSHEARISVLGMNYLMMGNLWGALGETEKQKSHYLEAAKIGNSINNGKVIYLGYSQYAQFLDPDSSILITNKALKFAERSNFRRTGFSYLRLSNAYFGKKMYDSAFVHIKKSIAINQADNYLLALVPSYKALSNLFIKQDNLDSSLFYAKKTLEVARINGLPKDLLEAYKVLSISYQLNNQMDSALKYEQFSNRLNDSLKNERILNLTGYQKYAFSEQLRLKRLDEEKTAYANNFKMAGLMAVLCTILLIAIILFRNYRHKHIANQFLEKTLTSLKSTQAQLIESEKRASVGQLRLSELDAVKSKLYTNITHEFRTPLTVILGVANQLLDNPQEHLNNGLKMIIRSGQNLLTLVNQMLDLSKLDSGKLSLQYHHADVVSFLGYIMDGFHSLAKTKGIQIHFISVKDQLYMDFDEVRLQQVVSNITSNAIKFTPKGGHVYISTDVKNDSFIIKIKDTGIGIAEADMPHIFDRFFQADDSQTRHGEGTGIGLALTHELVKLMKGTIAVKSKEGHGTEFEVMLPIRTISDPSEKKNHVPHLSMETRDEYPITMVEDAQSPLISKVHSENSRTHVLIADDNEDVLAFVASCLENEFVVEVAKNGRECEELALNIIPDLIVMDVMMPFKGGFEVCKTLKTDERTSHIPIIILTAKADLESRLEGLAQGADDYLTKPFHKKELLLRIRNLLDLRYQLQQYYRVPLEGSILADPLSNPNGSKITSGINGPNNAQAGSQHPSIPIARSLENAFVIKVRKTIETHMEEPDFDVEKLCRLLALSHSQVHRKLSALTGLSATHFIRYVRLIKAKEMIIKSGFSLAAIAYDCGFNDPAYFSRIFKQEFGMSPQVWKEQNSAV